MNRSALCGGPVEELVDPVQSQACHCALNLQHQHWLLWLSIHGDPDKDAGVTGWVPNWCAVTVTDGYCIQVCIFVRISMHPSGSSLLPSAQGYFTHNISQPTFHGSPNASWVMSTPFMKRKVRVSLNSLQSECTEVHFFQLKNVV